MSEDLTNVKTLQTEEQRRCAYLKQILTLSPEQNPEALLEARAQFFGIRHARRGASDENPYLLQSQREHAEQQLQSLRRSFWTMDLAELLSQLQRLDFTPFPDLQAALRKLRKVARNRRRFPQLVQHPANDSELFTVFKTVVILSPRQAAPHREKIVRRARKASCYKRFRHMLSAMQSEFPELFELEREWFELIVAG